jgi:trk system potassium uptake protein TrkA
MYIIVVGGGRVGYYLLKGLLNEGHEVLLLEKDARICAAITEEMGSVCYRGDGCEAATLGEVGASRADMLVAVTGDDADNLVACQVANHKYHVPRTIARIRNPQNEVLFKRLGIDVTVSTTNIILEVIEREVPTHPLTRLLTIEEKKLVIVDVRIAPESSTVGKAVKELALPAESKLVLVIPLKGDAHVPTGSTVLRGGDQVIAVTTPELREALQDALMGVPKKAQKK